MATYDGVVCFRDLYIKMNAKKRLKKIMVANVLILGSLRVIRFGTSGARHGPRRPYRRSLDLTITTMGDVVNVAASTHTRSDPK